MKHPIVWYNSKEIIHFPGEPYMEVYAKWYSLPRIFEINFTVEFGAEICK